MNFTYLSTHPGIIYGCAGLLLLGIYFTFIRSFISRNSNLPTPTSGETPELPAGLSPAALSYIKRRGFDFKVLTVALLDMAGRGYFRVNEQNGIYSLTRGEAGQEALTPDEREIALRLDFVRIPELVLGSGNRWIFKKALAAYKKYLKATYQPFYFTTNTRYSLPGLILGLAAIIGAGYYGDVEKTAMFLLYCVWVVIWGFAFRLLMKQTAASWNVAKGGPGFRFSGFIRFFLSLIFGIGVILVETYSLSSWLTITTPIIIGIVGAVLVLCFIFRNWLKVYTPAGREIMVRIAGLRRSLTGEGSETKSGEPSPESFNRDLPYAMALEVTGQYGRQFDARAHSLSGFNGANLTPQWYSGPKQQNRITASGFTDSFCQSFPGTIALMLLASDRER